MSPSYHTALRSITWMHWVRWRAVPSATARGARPDSPRAQLCADGGPPVGRHARGASSIVAIVDSASCDSRRAALSRQLITV
eukprot:scaffold35307_cov36-Tisochrysis_lutea.AAC.1